MQNDFILLENGCNHVLGYWNIKGREINLSEVGNWRSALEEPDHWTNYNYCSGCGMRMPKPNYWLQLFELVSINPKADE